MKTDTLIFLIFPWVALAAQMLLWYWGSRRLRAARNGLRTAWDEYEDAERFRRIKEQVFNDAHAGAYWMRFPVERQAMDIAGEAVAAHGVQLDMVYAMASMSEFFGADGFDAAAGFGDDVVRSLVLCDDVIVGGEVRDAH